ncbi:MAG: RNA polymerase sigma factor [Gemmatimonadaceae bacterium]|nr:RNA polymerase sigma factor [Gemmatimonadaceae bacterium]
MTATDPPDAVSVAFEREVLALLPDLARYARALTRDAADADDLVQETFLRAWRGWHTFDRARELRRWLLAICHHAFIRSRERARRIQLTDEGTDAELEALAAARGHAAAAREGLDVRLLAMDLGPAIRAAIDALAPPFRTVVLLVDVEGASYDEVATLLGIPIGTVRSRLFRARRVLQEALLEHARDAGFRTVAPTPQTITPTAPAP